MTINKKRPADFLKPAGRTVVNGVRYIQQCKYIKKVQIYTIF